MKNWKQTLKLEWQVRTFTNLIALKGYREIPLSHPTSHLRSLLWAPTGYFAMALACIGWWSNGAVSQDNLVINKKTKPVKKKKKKEKIGWRDYFMLGHWSCSQKHPNSIKVSAKESVQIWSHMRSQGWRGRWHLFSNGDLSHLMQSSNLHFYLRWLLLELMLLTNLAENFKQFFPSWFIFYEVSRLEKA